MNGTEEREKEITAKLVECDVPDSNNNVYSRGCFRDSKEDARQDDLTDETDYYIKCHSNPNDDIDNPEDKLTDKGFELYDMFKSLALSICGEFGIPRHLVEERFGEMEGVENEKSQDYESDVYYDENGNGTTTRSDKIPTSDDFNKAVKILQDKLPPHDIIKCPLCKSSVIKVRDDESFMCSCCGNIFESV